MNYLVITYTIYLILSLALTVWVAHTLSKNGRVFLVDCFHQNEPLAEAVNHLLVVGFYLINLGFISLFLTTSLEVVQAQQVFEVLSTKMGMVLLLLGVMHFVNLLVLAMARRRTMPALPPPIAGPNFFKGTSV
ncbi:hypothetical protein BH09VER1_BH09VER1_15300 [soil metagenome]